MVGSAHPTRLQEKRAPQDLTPTPHWFSLSCFLFSTSARKKSASRPHPNPTLVFFVLLSFFQICKKKERLKTSPQPHIGFLCLTFFFLKESKLIAKLPQGLSTLLLLFTTSAFFENFYNLTGRL